jgi:short-subunit dehydrogenase
VKAIIAGAHEFFGGRVVKIISGIALIPMPYQTVYAASKYSVRRQSWQLNLKGFTI